MSPPTFDECLCPFSMPCGFVRFCQPRPLILSSWIFYVSQANECSMLIFGVFFLQAIQQLQARTAHGQSSQTVPMTVFLVGAALDIFQTLIVDLDTEGRYLFLNAVANQLRYPNTHTHYFSFILLYLFAESNQVRKNVE